MEFQFETMGEFFDMGGYAFFVWLSFISTFVCMLAILFQSLFVSKKIKQAVEKEAARAQRIIDARAARQEKKRLKEEAEAASIEANIESVERPHNGVSSEPNSELSGEDNNEPKT